jgi:plasmid stabilization system protein ParE
MDNKEESTRKTYKVILSENALTNLDEVTGYIAFVNHQPLNAIKIGNDFFELFEKIQSNPFVFKECEEIPTKQKIYRKARCHSWYVIFKIIATEILILGIMHASKKPSKIKSLKKIKP